MNTDLMGSKQEKAFIEYQPRVAAEWMRQGGIVATSFGQIYAFFCLPEFAESMVTLKGKQRVGRPFTYTTSQRRLPSDIFSQPMPGLSLDIPSNIREVIGKILKLGSEDKPIGLLLPADPNSNISELGIGTTKVNGKDVLTVGIMVASSNDKEYNELLDYLNVTYIPGTSANISKDPYANLSGHHRPGLLRAHFKNKEVCLLAPKKLIDVKKGGSTSIVYISPEGEAHFVRIGSISEVQMKNILKQAGIRDDKIVIREEELSFAKPYDYRRHPGGLVKATFHDALFWTGAILKRIPHPFVHHQPALH